MKEKSDWVMLALVAILLVSIIIVAIRYTNSTVEVTEVENGTIDPNYWDAKPFTLINDFSYAHNYSASEYNCINYTRDLAIVLNDNGYTNTIRCGCNVTTIFSNGYTHVDKRCHEWLQLCFEKDTVVFCVDVEPQSGRIVNYVEEYPIECDKEWRTL